MCDGLLWTFTRVPTCSNNCGDIFSVERGFGDSRIFTRTLKHFVMQLDRVANFTEARSTLSAVTGIRVDFLAGLHFDQLTDQLMVLAGSNRCAIMIRKIDAELCLNFLPHSAELSICNVANDGSLRYQSQLRGGHVDVVRAFFWDPQVNHHH